MKIVIVGLGIIGGGYAKGLHQRTNLTTSEEVYGLDHNLDTLKEAERLGIIQIGYHKSEHILPEADVVILALYPDQIKPFLVENRHLFKDNALVMEATGIKQYLIEQIDRVIPKNVDFIYTHPMAGGEQQGIQYSNPNVFYGANFLIIPQPSNQSQHLEWVENFAKRLGFGHIEYVTAEEHDEMIAYTSQLPHAIAVSLMNSTHLPGRVAEFTGDSFRDLTRIADINEKLWSELFLMNRQDLLTQINIFQARLTQLATTLEEADEAALQKLFIESAQKHQALVKHRRQS